MNDDICHIKHHINKDSFGGVKVGQLQCLLKQRWGESNIMVVKDCFHKYYFLKLRVFELLLS